MPADVDSIDAREAHAKIGTDPDAFLVCAYDDPAKFEQNRLEDAISLQDFQKRIPDLPKDRDIIFYCA